MLSNSHFNYLRALEGELEFLSPKQLRFILAQLLADGFDSDRVQTLLKFHALVKQSSPWVPGQGESEEAAAE